MPEPQIKAPSKTAAASAAGMAHAISGLEGAPAAWPFSLAVLQLIRFPNLFTVTADILAGYLIAMETFAWMPLGGVLLAGLAIYAGGCALNDYVDRFADLRLRPQRPIPAGRIPSAFARRLSVGLLLLGFGAAWATGSAPVATAVIMIALLGSYNFAAKKHETLGPLNLGALRSLNLLLGMSAGAIPLMSAFGCASLTLLYVAVFRGMSGEEGDNPYIGNLLRWSMLGIVLLDAGYVLVLKGWSWSLPVAACLVPAHYYARRIPIS